jgi:outer membrane immunogenic protein
MRTVLFSLAAAAAVVATPALANEGRVEARGGVIWGGGDTEATAGAALGYDFDLGTSAFVGAEVSGDKILVSNTKVAFGFTGRVGAKLSEAGKLYANGGYTTEFCDACKGSWHAGAGYQQDLGTQLYGKVEYRHFFPEQNLVSDSDAVSVGLGLRF